MPHLDTFTKQYIETALWSSNDEAGRLTDNSHAYGEFNLYVGDDGMIYGT